MVWLRVGGVLVCMHVFCFFFFFFNDTATTEIYTLSLHDALPIRCRWGRTTRAGGWAAPWRSEEHTSELQSRRDLVCRLLLEKKKKIKIHDSIKNKKQTKYNNHYQMHMQ